MYRFQNDYNEVAHPAVLKAITDTAGHRHDGYGTDTLCGCLLYTSDAADE